MDFVMIASAGTGNRIFGLDVQTIVDTGITMIAVFALFVLLSFLLFKPARELMRKRQEYIEGQLSDAAVANEEAEALKVEYHEKMQKADATADEILAEARKKALGKSNEIVDEAKEEAGRIINRANKDVELEKSKVKDEMKQEMVEVASLMASRFIEEGLDDKKQAQLVDETLEKMGDGTWQK